MGRQITILVNLYRQITDTLWRAQVVFEGTLSRISLNIYRSEKCFLDKICNKKLNVHFAHRTVFFKTFYFRYIFKKCG